MIIYLTQLQEYKTQKSKLWKTQYKIILGGFDMKNIYDILTTAGIEIPAEKKAEINKALLENYKTVAEVEKIKEKAEKDIEPLQEKISIYEEQLSKIKGVDVNGLQGKITELENTILNLNKKQEQEKSEQEISGIISNFYGALQDKEFVNDFTKEAITQKIKAALSDPSNKGKGVSELFNELTKGKESVFKTPNQLVDIPAVGSVSVNIDAAKFAKMGYAERVKLKVEQPEVYKTLRGD